MSRWHPIFGRVRDSGEDEDGVNWDEIDTDLLPTHSGWKAMVEEVNRMGHGVPVAKPAEKAKAKKDGGFFGRSDD